MFYDGLATNTIDEHLKNIYDVDVDSSNIWRWVQKYSKMACDYLYQFPVKLSNVWIIDETMVKVNGVNHWFWDVIDQDTRFLVGTHLSRKRTLSDATILFRKCKYRAKNKPKMIFSDKMWAYHRAINRVFYSRFADKRTEHIQVKGLTKSAEKNIIERFHGSVKQRYKVMRGLKTTKSAKIILETWGMVHYNYFKPHETLGDIPPIQKTDYKPKFSNWVELIDEMENVLLDNPFVCNVPKWGDLEGL
jgi:transposase-like protein